MGLYRQLSENHPQFIAKNISKTKSWNFKIESTLRDKTGKQVHSIWSSLGGISRSGTKGCVRLPETNSWFRLFPLPQDLEKNAIIQSPAAGVSTGKPCALIVKPVPPPVRNWSKQSLSKVREQGGLRIQDSKKFFWKKPQSYEKVNF